MHFSVLLAVFFGILFSPISGFVYGYMLWSGDRTPWRVILVGIGLGAAFGVISAMLLATINQARLSGNQAASGTQIGTATNVQGTSWAELSQNTSPSHTVTSGIDTVYQVACKGAATSFSDCADPKRAGQFSFNVNVVSQTVAASSPDFANVQQSNDCQVTDINNWTCAKMNADTGVSVKETFKDGQFFSTASSPKGYTRIFVSQEQYLRLTQSVWQ